MMSLRAIVTACIAVLAVASGHSAEARCKDYVPQPKPQNASRDIVGADIDTIIDRGYIDVAVYEDFAPWSFELAGEPAGIDVDIANLIAEDLGVKARVYLVAAGENLDVDLRNWIWKGPIVGGAVKKRDDACPL